MSGILCLKWNNHTSTFIKTLDNLRSKELYCDATIACQGKYFPVHRFVLTTCSEYFEEIFERTQCKHPFIIVKDIEELQLESLLNYMYKGEVNVLQDRLPGLIRAAEALKVKGLAVPEDDNETKNSIKEKRKSNVSSSPLEPKSKRRLDRNPSERLHHGSKEDDDVIETLSQSSNSSPKTQQKRLRDNLNNSKTKNQEPEFPNTSAYNKGNDTEVEDIKIEPSEIFETVDEDFPIDDAENEVIASQDEDSLFVSLLSPNNAQLPSEEEMIRSEMNSSAIPQCSSWTEDMDKSKETHDDMNAIKVKTTMTFKEPSPAGLSFGVNSFSSSPTTEALLLYKTPYLCPHCNHRTRTKQEILRHISYYHSNFRYTCTLCYYKCRTNSLLKKHMLRHAKEKPYSCPLCSYKTARKQHLVRHSKLHTGEKPFSCTVCSYKAARKDRLRDHLRKHSEIGEFNLV